MQSFEEIMSTTDQKTLALWAADCAEHVLPYFEEHYPDDHRPRSAIEAGRAWARGEIKVGQARAAALAAHAAARESIDGAARAAARAAGHAAATAHVGRHALGPVIYGARAAFTAADYTEAEAASAREQAWQYQRLLERRGTAWRQQSD